MELSLYFRRWPINALIVKNRKYFNLKIHSADFCWFYLTWKRVFGVQFITITNWLFVTTQYTGYNSQVYKTTLVYSTDSSGVAADFPWLGVGKKFDREGGSHDEGESHAEKRGSFFSNVFIIIIFTISRRRRIIF